MNGYAVFCAGSDTAKERQEGLAEYTGVVIAMRATGEDVSRAARLVESFEDSDAYARSFGYATGPALGMLLDRYATGWRDRAATTALYSMRVSALNVQTSTSLQLTAQQRARLYGYPAVVAVENERGVAQSSARQVDAQVH